MSASVSSLIDPLVRHRLTEVIDPGQVPQDLLTALRKVPDPRDPRGVRHEFAAILGIAVCAVLAGARSFIAIAEWSADLPSTVRVGLGIGRRSPCETTIRRLLQRLDADRFDEVISGWLAGRQPAATPQDAATTDRPKAPRAVAIDGKTVRGARGVDGRAPHLLAALDHETGVVLGQTAVGQKTNEINAFASLLDTFDITGTLVTADALHTQTKHAHYLHSRGAHYLLTVKGNQPTLHRELKKLLWKQIPTVDVTTDKGHGRLETRSLKIVQAPRSITFPHVRLAIELTRRRKSARGGRWTTEIVHLITDLDYQQATAALLADAQRGHWGIENRLHWVRDVSFGEDLSQVRTGAGPQVMASLRNLAISVHRKAGAANIAAACRHVSRHPNRVLPLIT